jgi:hypothetical protein
MSHPVIKQAQEMITLTEPQRALIDIVVRTIEMREDDKLPDLLTKLQKMSDSPTDKPGGVYFLTPLLDRQIAHLLSEGYKIVDHAKQDATIVETIKKAMATMESAAIEYALEEAANSEPPLDHPIIKEAGEMLEELLQEEDVLSRLEASLKQGDASGMKASLTRAKSFKVVRHAARRATLVSNAEMVMEALENLSEQTEKQSQAWERELAPVLEARSALLSLHIEGVASDLLANASDLINELEAETHARRSLDAAILERVMRLCLYYF